MNVAFQCLGLVLVVAMSLYYRMENKHRDQVEGGKPAFGQKVDVIDKYDQAPGQYNMWMSMKSVTEIMIRFPVCSVIAIKGVL